MRMAIPVRENSENGEAISGSGTYLYNFWFMYFQKCKILFVFQISGTKLKCPFCERTYGYETNLRAHIRQRHQGIRVSCPYCPRTFTRNNTVRRHVQREHRNETARQGGRFPQKFSNTRVMPDPIRQLGLASIATLAHHGVAAREDAGNNGGTASPPPAATASNIVASSSVAP